MGEWFMGNGLDSTVAMGNPHCVRNDTWDRKCDGERVGGMLQVATGDQVCSRFGAAIDVWRIFTLTKRFIRRGLRSRARWLNRELKIRNPNF